MCKIFISFLLMVFVFGAAGQSDFRPVEDVEAVGGRLNQMAKSLQSIQSDFHQEKYMDFLNVSLESEGKFWFQKENMLRWEYTKPFNYIVIINDGVVQISDEGREQEFRIKGNRIFEQVNKIIVASMSGDVVEDESFDVEFFENPDLYLVKMKPLQKEVAQVINEMEMYFEKESLHMSKIIMKEPNGDHTVIRYFNRKTNEPIPSAMFRF